jgi:hypothetical protein
MIFLCCLASLIAGCSSYTPVGDYGGFPHGGYTNSPLNANTQIVGYTGNMFASESTAKNYMLYRSAKVTLDNGYDYFVILSSSYSNRNVHVVTEDSYNGYNSDPPRLHNVFSRSAFPRSFYTSKTSIRYRRANQCEISDPHGAVAVIKMFRGNIPLMGMPNAYQASDVIAHLGVDNFGATTY